MISTSRRRQSEAFSLFELTVVLAILAIATTLAFRSLDQLQDQRRYDATVQLLDEVHGAVVGSTADRGIDGTLTPNSFFADMGRLPRKRDDTSSGLSELWLQRDLPSFQVLQANTGNVSDAQDADLQVYLAGGWRGPYIRLPFTSSDLLDGWGNALSTEGDAASDIHIIRSLGANGQRADDDSGYDADQPITFPESLPAELTTTVEIADGENPATVANAADVVVRVFSYTPDGDRKIVVHRMSPSQAQNPAIVEFNGAAGLTAGVKTVRAYFANGRRSAVKQVNLRPGPNLLSLTIDR